jgi:site-specific DNA recombinase
MNSDRGRARKADPALLKAVARAHRWFDDLVTRRVSSMAEIGKREGLPKYYVSWLVRLAFLAPDIVEAIVPGNHPPELTAQALTRLMICPCPGRLRRLHSSSEGFASHLFSLGQEFDRLG